MNRRQAMMGAAVIGLGLVASGTLAAARATDDGSAEAIVERYAASLTAHDITAFGALFADDDVDHEVSVVAPPSPGKPAKQATIDLFAARLTGLPDLRVDVEVTTASSDRAAASFLYTGTHTEPYLGVAPTERRLRFTSCDIFMVRQGLIVEHWGMGDIAGIMA